MKTIEIGGKQRPVLYDINALAEFNEATKTSLDWIFKMLANPLTMDMNQFRWMAYVGLKNGCEETNTPVDFNLKDVGKWLTADFKKWEEFMAALAEGFPGADESKKK
jgi:hypothetical protein